MNKPDLHTAARWAPAVVCCLLVAMMLGGFAWYAGLTRSIVQATRDTQVTNTHLNKQTNANTFQIRQLARQVAAGNAQIADCIQPTGECAKAAAARTAHVLDQFQILVVIAGLCESSETVPKTYEAQSACIHHLAVTHGIGPK